jgi:hypothetical protein
MRAAPCSLNFDFFPVARDPEGPSSQVPDDPKITGQVTPSVGARIGRSPHRWRTAMALARQRYGRRGRSIFSSWSAAMKVERQRTRRG